MLKFENSGIAVGVEFDHPGVFDGNIFTVVDPSGNLPYEASFVCFPNQR
jgi:hypothetical protein